METSFERAMRLIRENSYYGISPTPLYKSGMSTTEELYKVVTSTLVDCIRDLDFSQLVTEKDDEVKIRLIHSLKIYAELLHHCKEGDREFNNILHTLTFSVLDLRKLIQDASGKEKDQNSINDIHKSTELPLSDTNTPKEPIHDPEKFVKMRLAIIGGKDWDIIKNKYNSILVNSTNNTAKTRLHLLYNLLQQYRYDNTGLFESLLEEFETLLNSPHIL